MRSPSVRRAWIEISQPKGIDKANTSPSVRRAWIEIRFGEDLDEGELVALREEGVD